MSKRKVNLFIWGLFFTLSLTFVIDTIAQSKDSVRCSKLAVNYVKKQISNENKSFKKMFVKSCYDVSNTTTLVGVRTLIVEEDGDMFYNYIVTINREKPKKPFVANVFSISDKKRKEIFPDSFKEE